jgi:hypothetical protein
MLASAEADERSKGLLYHQPHASELWNKMYVRPRAEADKMDVKDTISVSAMLVQLVGVCLAGNSCGMIDNKASVAATRRETTVERASLLPVPE